MGAWNKSLVWASLTSLLVCFVSACFGQSPVRSEFTPFESAQPVLEGMSDVLPPELLAPGLDSAKWSTWVQSKDREVRDRLIRGEEDTLANLLRFGVTFTKEYRIDDEYLARYEQSSLVNAFAENRANDLIRAWMAPHPSEGLLEMRIFVEKRGYSLRTAQERARTKKYLLDNLSRLRDDFLKYRAQPKDERRANLFQDRGISLDTNLWPDYVLDAAFRALLQKGILKPGRVTRIAVVGPGLDFANKEAGSDFYPPQTIQPFAVLDSLIRLKIADPNAIALDTFDISENVNLHLARIRQEAVRGRSYSLQLPWNTERPLSDEFRVRFIEYWQQLGDQIGRPMPPIRVPEAADATRTRAIEVRPDIVARVTAFDVNVVYQRLVLPPDGAYDLVIGTNIFVYYGPLEQSLARANVSAMVRPGGVLISNDKLSERVPSGLKDVLEVPVVLSEQPWVEDIGYCYQRAD